MSKDDPNHVDAQSAQDAQEFGEKLLQWADRLVTDGGVDPHDVATTLITSAQYFAAQQFGPHDTARWLYSIADNLATTPPKPQEH